MSITEDSPVSSSSDDFAAFLDAELETNSSETSPGQEVESVDEDVSDDLGSVRIKRRKLDESEDGEDPQGLTSDGAQEQVSFINKEACQHPGVFGGLCIRCGQMMEDGSGVPFGYIHQHLKLADEEIARLRITDLKNLLRNKKLYLVLDLDHTLLNSTRLLDITSEEEYLKSQTDSLQDVSSGSIFRLDSMHMLTKLRPFVHTFLKEASGMFEMCIYTMAERSYAMEIAKLLDPGRIYFSSRVISQADCTQRHQKGLDVVLGQESAVVILDDTEIVWQKHRENLILMERYHYFASSCRQFGFNCKSLSETKSDESESDGALASILKVLKRIHEMFFDLDHGADVTDRDVRQVMKSIRQEVLKGCKLVFSRVFPMNTESKNHQLWKMSEQLGAICCRELDPSVTHVVSTDIGTEKARWALRNEKFLIHPRWIEAANYLWQRQPEEKFSLNSIKKQ